MTNPVPACDCANGAPAPAGPGAGNRPGQSSISYRAGTYATLMAAMLGRLGSVDGLTNFRTRDPGDPAIALLDAWAVVGDVLTFYQERIANEGYLSTATQDRSVTELGRLTGYVAPPAMSAGTFISYTVATGYSADIPAGSSVQSMPAPGAVPQVFETGQGASASDALNDYGLRITQPTDVQSQLHASDAPGAAQSDTVATLYFKGVSVNLKPNDPLLFVEPGGKTDLRRIATVVPQSKDNRTQVTLAAFVGQTQATQPAQAPPAPAQAARAAAKSPPNPPPSPAPPQAPAPAPSPTPPAPAPTVFGTALSLRKALAVPPAVPPTGPTALGRNLSDMLRETNRSAYSLISAVSPVQPGQIEKALADNPDLGAPQPIQVYALRIRSAPFGNNAPRRPIVSITGKIVGYTEWTLSSVDNGQTEDVDIDITTTVATTFGAAKVDVNVTIQGVSTSATGTVPAGQTVTIDYSAAGGEQIDASFDDSTMRLVLWFSVRKARIEVNGLDGTGTVSAVGSGDGLLSVRAALLSTTPNLLIHVSGSLLGPAPPVFTETPNVVSLETPQNSLPPGGWVVIDRPASASITSLPLVFSISKVQSRTRSDYGLTGKVTDIVMDPSNTWISPDDGFDAIRKTTVHAGSELLDLAEEPISAGVSGSSLELSSLLLDAAPGQLAIVEGDRTDVPGAHAAEVVMVSEVRHDVAPGVPQDTVHTFLTLQPPLAYTYDRATVTAHGNVVPASHGRTVTQVLGSGDASKTNQSFALLQGPIVYLADGPGGTASKALSVTVGGLPWSERPSFQGAGPKDRVYVARTDAGGTTTVTFGDGVRGARVPTGQENVAAAYRVGGGSQGNVDAGALSLLLSRPLHVTGVVNPVAAAGGQDAPGIDAHRQGQKAGIRSLGRLDSLSDYGDFALSLAGVGKASVVRIARRFYNLVYLTIAGTDETPLAADDPLLQGISSALAAAGDPGQAVAAGAARARLMIVSASAGLIDGAAWSEVEPAIRAALLQRFGFAARSIGTPILRSDVVATIQSVPGVSYLTLACLDSLGADFDAAALAALVAKSQVVDIVPAGAVFDPASGTVTPAEIAYLPSTVDDAIALTELST